jgi:AcrR family transcriptional regulator
MKDARAALLQAAAEEFAEAGLKGARIQSIVRRSGVNERMIYHHFGSKEGLYLATVEAQRAGIGQQWHPVLEQAATMSPYDGMRSALRGLLEVFRQRPLLLALLMHEWLSGSAISPLPTPAMLPAQLRVIYESGQRDGTFTAAPFELAYGVAVSALVSATVFAGRQWNGVDPGWSADDIVTQLVDGMTGP